MGDAAAGRLLASDHNLEFVDLDRYSIDTSAARLLPEAVARHHHVVPIGRKFGAPVVAITDPTDVLALDTLRASMGREFVTVVAPDDQIEACLTRVYRSDAAPTMETAGPGASNGTAADATVDANAAVMGAAAGLSEVDAPLQPPSMGEAPEASPAVWQTPLDTVFEATPLPPFSAGRVDLCPRPTAGPRHLPAAWSAPSDGADQDQAFDEVTTFPPLARVLVEGDASTWPPCAMSSPSAIAPGRRWPASSPSGAWSTSRT